MGETKLASMNYLNIISYRDLFNWSAAHLLGNGLCFTKRYPFVRIGALLKPNRNIISVEDNVVYKQVTLRTNGGGAVLRGVKVGKDIGTKKQYQITTGQFIMSKIDARNGAFGIVDDSLNEAIVTGDFPVFDVDKEKLNSAYLHLLSSTKQFIRFAQSCSRGTTNRQRIDIKQFLNLQIPLPSLEEQNAIVANYKNSLSLVDQYEQQAEQINNSINTYLLQELGLNTALSTQEHVKRNYKYLLFANMKDMLERWDIYNMTNSIFNVLEHAKYPVVSIGNTYALITRTWRKTGETFRYVELGDVSPLYGITNAQTLDTKKAPSRATQTIQAKDLIIGTTRPYLKRFAIVTDDYANNVCSSGFQVIAPNDRYNLQFLYEFLKTEVATKQFEHYMTGALYPAITNKDLRKIQIPLPPLDVQNKIVAHISKLKENIKSLRALASTTRTAAIQQFEKTIFE